MSDSKYDIAIISQEFPPFSVGGVGEWAFYVAENLARFGHRVTVFSRWKKKTVNNIHSENGFAIRKMWGHNWNRRYFWYSIFYIYWYLRKYPAAILIATTWQYGYCFAWLRHFFPDAKLIVVAHGREITRKFSRIDAIRLNRTLDCATLVVSVSGYTRNVILKKTENLYSNKIVMIHNGIDLQKIYPVKNYSRIEQRLGILSKDKVILTLARVVEIKGHDLVIRCLPTILQKYPNLKYVIAGPWEVDYYQKLKWLIANLNLNNIVVFSGLVSGDEINELYSRCSIYVLMSRVIETNGRLEEAFPISVLEASACGRPVIGSKTGGMPEAIADGETGLLVPPEDIDALAEKILFLLDNPNIANEMGGKGLKRIKEEFTWDNITKKIIENFEEYAS